MLKLTLWRWGIHPIARISPTGNVGLPKWLFHVGLSLEYTHLVALALAVKVIGPFHVSQEVGHALAVRLINL